MNIFWLSPDTYECAKWHCDKHIVKMPLETAQMLCTNVHHIGFKAKYKPTHKNHPCTIWARESRWNFALLCQLGISLCLEYEYRYGRRHACLDVILECQNFWTKFPNDPATDIVLCMDDKYKTDCPFESYQDFYRDAKKDFLKYTKRDVPKFLLK